MYETEKKIWGGQGGNRFTEKVESSDFRKSVNQTSDNKPLTRDIVAKEYGVSGSTISDNLVTANVIDILPEKSRNNVLSGKDSIPRDGARVILKMPKPIQKKFIAEVEQGTPIKEAIKKYGCYYRKFRDFKREKISRFTHVSCGGIREGAKSMF